MSAEKHVSSRAAMISRFSGSPRHLEGFGTRLELITKPLRSPDTSCIDAELFLERSCLGSSILFFLESHKLATTPRKLHSRNSHEHLNDAPGIIDMVVARLQSKQISDPPRWIGDVPCMAQGICGEKLLTKFKRMVLESGGKGWVKGAVIEYIGLGSGDLLDRSISALSAGRIFTEDSHIREGDGAAPGCTGLLADLLKVILVGWGSGRVFAEDGCQTRYISQTALRFAIEEEDAVAKVVPCNELGGRRHEGDGGGDGRKQESGDGEELHWRNFWLILVRTACF
ncbi:hypothetical protein B0H19DRAFT_1236571 [Mycena capillaripes]|nr:hypothetical protein B0H19DRAFT_1236571 [Mycena capillaripes]